MSASNSSLKLPIYTYFQVRRMINSRKFFLASRGTVCGEISFVYAITKNVKQIVSKMLQQFCFLFFATDGTVCGKTNRKIGVTFYLTIFSIFLCIKLLIFCHGRYYLRRPWMYFRLFLIANYFWDFANNTNNHAWQNFLVLARLEHF